MGNGKYINFWIDNWLPNNQALRGQIQGPFLKGEESKNIHSLQDNSSWRLNDISFTFLKKIIDLLTKTCISQNNNLIDRAIWPYIISGIFTVKSAYQLHSTKTSSFFKTPSQYN